MIPCGSDPQIAIIEVDNAEKRTKASKSRRQSFEKKRLNIAGLEYDKDSLTAPTPKSRRRRRSHGIQIFGNGDSHCCGSDPQIAIIEVDNAEKRTKASKPHGLSTENL